MTLAWWRFLSVLALFSYMVLLVYSRVGTASLFAVAVVWLYADHVADRLAQEREVARATAA